jgi:hypothetical protein
MDRIIVGASIAVDISVPRDNAAGSKQLFKISVPDGLLALGKSLVHLST